MNERRETERKACRGTADVTHVLQTVLEPARHIVQDRDDGDDNDDDAGAGDGAHGGGLQRMADGDVTLHRERHRQPHRRRLRHQRHRVEVDDDVGQRVPREGGHDLAQRHEQQRHEEDDGVPDGEGGEEAVGGGVHGAAGEHGDGQGVAHQPQSRHAHRQHAVHVEAEVAGPRGGHRWLAVVAGQRREVGTQGQRRRRRCRHPRRPVEHAGGVQSAVG